MQPDVTAYHQKLTAHDAEICNLLYQTINANLANAENKVWHAHPVWFLEGNPIVGYHKLKDGVRLLFWSGQSFDEPALKKEGKFKAAEIRYNNVDEIDVNALKKWLQKAATIQWDYKNIVKRRGQLERLK